MISQNKLNIIMLTFAFLRNRTFFFSSFRKFAQTMLKVQQDSSLKVKKKIMEEYFNTADSADKSSIISILNFIRDKPKTGLATKSIHKYLLNTYFPDIQNPSNDLDQLVDLLEDNHDQDTTDQTGVKLQEVQQFLDQIQTTQKGKGSTTKKLQNLDNILSNMSQIEFKVMMRIITKKLRVGLTSKSLNLSQEQAQAQTAITPQNAQKLHNSEKLKNQPKVESEKKIKKKDTHTKNQQPMLSKALKNIEDVKKFCEKKESKNLIADIKYDGQRTWITYVRGSQIQLMSRNTKEQNQIHNLLAKQLQQQIDKISQIQSIKIDGEIVCVTGNDEPLKMSLVRSNQFKYNTDQSKMKKMVYAFDVLQYNGESLLKHKLIERRKKIPETLHIKMCQYMKFTYPEDFEKLVDFFKQSLQRKYEGLIIKGEQDLYDLNGTRKHWGKFKRGCSIDKNTQTEVDLDAVVMGVAYGQGKRTSYLSSFLIGLYLDDKLYPITKLGSGFTQQQLEQFTEMFKNLIVQEKPDQYEMPKNLSIQHYVKPQVVFQIKSQQTSHSPFYRLGYEKDLGGLSLRFPVFCGLRFDKDPKSCIAEDIFDYAKQKK